MNWLAPVAILAAIVLFVVFWFVVVAPMERRDHERRLAILRKRIAEREALKQAESGADGGVGKASEGTADDDHPGRAAEYTRGGAPRPG